MKQQKLKIRCKRLLTSLTAFFCTAFWHIQGFAESTAPSMDGIDPQKAISSLAGFLLSLLQGVGIIAVIWGIVQVAMGFKSQEGTQKIHGVMFLVGGLIFLGLKSVLGVLGVTV